jgi:hypothetical protein
MKQLMNRKYNSSNDSPPSLKNMNNHLPRRVDKIKSWPLGFFLAGLAIGSSSSDSESDSDSDSESNSLRL